MGWEDDKMKMESLIEKYVQKTEAVLKKIELAEKPVFDSSKIDEVVNEAKRYLEDAKYYLSKRRLETSLASVAYSEGLLDALRMLDLVKFEW
ncbi:hypothetical protein DRO35_00365 [Candidatus Bathyarchaeota archaeon]|nr:MAG: hypothetical protein DRO35_00365 [Candidatus Bathyarchaeota archaeon]